MFMCFHVCVGSGSVFLFMRVHQQAYPICSWRSDIGIASSDGNACCLVLPLSVSYFLVLRYDLWHVAFSVGPLMHIGDMEDQQVAGCVALGLQRLTFCLPATSC